MTQEVNAGASWVAPGSSREPVSTKRGLKGYTKCSVLPKAHTGMHIFPYMSAHHTHTNYIHCVCVCVLMRMMIIVMNLKERRRTSLETPAVILFITLAYVVVVIRPLRGVSFPGLDSGSVEKLLSTACISLYFLTVDTMRTTSMPLPWWTVSCIRN